MTDAVRSPSMGEHKQVDAASYDGMAPAFDALTERFAAPLATTMLRLAAPQSGNVVLDAGTGTGLVALQAARLVPGGRVTGIDHSRGMLRQARLKAAERGLTGTVEFRQMDAEALDFADTSFDRVLSLFMLYHLGDPVAAVREMHRVLRPGGRLVVGVGRGPHLMSRSGVIQAGRRVGSTINALRGRLLTAPSLLRRMLAERGHVPRFAHVTRPGALGVPGLMRDAGFRGIRSHWQGLRPVLDPEEFWQIHVVYGSEERIALPTLSPVQMAELKTAFLETCRHVQSRGGRLVYPYGAMFYVATSSRSVAPPRS